MLAQSVCGCPFCEICCVPRSHVSVDKLVMTFSVADRQIRYLEF